MYSQSNNGHFKTQMNYKILGCAVKGWQLDGDEQLLILLMIKLTRLLTDSLGTEQETLFSPASLLIQFNPWVTGRATVPLFSSVSLPT